jgi:hypothetical protein
MQRDMMLSLHESAAFAIDRRRRARHRLARVIRALAD